MLGRWLTLVVLAGLLPGLTAGCAIVPLPGKVEQAQGPLPPPPPPGRLVEGDWSKMYDATECALAPEEKVVVLSADGAFVDSFHRTWDHAREIRERLLALDPGLQIVDASTFRDALAPWFEHGGVLLRPELFIAMVDQDPVRARITSLNLRYLIVVKGRRWHNDPTPVMGLLGTAPSMGAMAREQVSLSAAVWDLKRGVAVGEAEVTAGGTWTFLPVVIGVLATVPMTERTAYRAIAERLQAFLRGRDVATVAPRAKRTLDVDFAIASVDPIELAGCADSTAEIG